MDRDSHVLALVLLGVVCISSVVGIGVSTIFGCQAPEPLPEIASASFGALIALTKRPKGQDDETNGKSPPQK